MQKVIIIGILIILGVVVYKDFQSLEVHAKIKQTDEPFICSKYDEIIKIKKCHKNFLCEVTLKSGKVITYQSPIIGEIVPCNI